jgi:hypothetical protein
MIDSVFGRRASLLAGAAAVVGALISAGPVAATSDGAGSFGGANYRCIGGSGSCGFGCRIGGAACEECPVQQVPKCEDTGDANLSCTTNSTNLTCTKLKTGLLDNGLCPSCPNSSTIDCGQKDDLSGDRCPSTN